MGAGACGCRGRYAILFLLLVIFKIEKPGIILQQHLSSDMHEYPYCRAYVDLFRMKLRRDLKSRKVIIAATKSGKLLEAIGARGSAPGTPEGVYDTFQNYLAAATRTSSQFCVRFKTPSYILHV